MNYEEYSLEYKDYLQRIADKLKTLTGSSNLTVQQFSTSLNSLDQSYRYGASTLPAPTPIVIDDWSKMSFENKNYLRSYAEALRTRCNTNFGDIKLTVAQMAAMTEALSVDNTAIYVCQRITVSDFQPTFSNFYIENYGTIPIEGCDYPDIAISDVEYFVGETPQPDDPQITQYHLIVKYYVTIKNPYEGGDKYYIRIEATSDIGDVSSDWAIISSNGELETENDSGEIGGEESTFEYSVVDMAQYGFSLVGDYYTSQNGGVDESYSLCRINFTVTKTQDIQIEAKYSGERNYDYGIFGNINQVLERSNEEDYEYKFSFKDWDSPASTTIVYEGITPGTYFIEVKYRKDVSVSSNDDVLQFKVLNGTNSGGSGGENPDLDLSTAIYATGYAGYSINGAEFSVYKNGEFIGNIQTIDADSTEINLVLHDGTKLEGTYENIYTGYYSEYGGEPNYEFYFVGTLKSLSQNSGDSYKIELRNYMIYQDITFNSGTDMTYIDRPVYVGDFSNPRQFSAWLGINENQAWASNGFYISVQDSNSSWGTTQKIEGEESYWLPNGSVVITRMESSYTDIEWGTAETILIDGTVYGYGTITAVVLHATPNITEDLDSGSVQYATIIEQ